MTTIQGRVLNPQGGPVAEAAVYIISAPVRIPDIAQLTDDQGQFTLSAPLPGRYTVGIRSDTWGTTQTEIEVSNEGVITVEVRFAP